VSVVFEQACGLGLEGIANSPAVKREAEQD
jgi:hypothetical protein